MKERRELMLALQRQGFVLHDIALYLDTHPDDQSALAKYRELMRAYKSTKSIYTEKFGPLTPCDSTSADKWAWVEGP